LFRRGTRVVEDLVQLDDFARPPWTLRHLQGHIDVAFVELTPGTRTGVIRDAAYAALREGMRALEARLIDVIEEQRRAEEERASRDQLKVIQRAFREALLALPAEEYLPTPPTSAPTHSAEIRSTSASVLGCGTRSGYHVFAGPP
jgi:hypothetical protein